MKKLLNENSAPVLFCNARIQRVAKRKYTVLQWIIQKNASLCKKQFKINEKRALCQTQFPLYKKAAYKNVIFNDLGDANNIFMKERNYL